MIHIGLDDRGSRWCFSLLLVLTAGLFSWATVRIWVAAYDAASSKQEQWRRAAQLEPGNASYWAKLGSFEDWDFERSNLRQAAEDYEKAVATNPYSDRYWMELAGVYERLGEILRARAAYEKAQANHPISSQVAWRYGNFLLRQGNVSQASAEFHRALLVDPELTEVAVAECWKTGAYTPRSIAKFLPPQSRYFLKAVNYFRQQNELDTALVLWEGLLALRERFELPDALPIINDLVSAGRVTEAQLVWQQALAISGWPRDTMADSSVVFNGSFEHDLAKGGFDWREEDVSHAFFVFDVGIAHSGARSLRVTFDGESNLDFQHLLQYVPVEANRRYRFTVYLKSLNLSTDSGMRFMIADPLHPSRQKIYTAGVIGTESWTRIETKLVTQADTHLLSIVLRRTPSAKFDNKLKGTVWVDDVSLLPLTDDDKDLRP